MASTCHFVSCFDVTRNYASLAHLAGLLAGFAFTTLGTVLSVSLASRQQFESRLPQLRVFVGVLFCAFVGLGFSAYNYIFVGGEEVSAGRALSEGLIADASMMTATLLLPLAIVELIDFAMLGKRIVLLRETVAVLLLFLYFVLVTETLNLQDTNLAQRLSPLPGIVGWAMTPILLLIGIGGGWQRRPQWKPAALRLSRFGLAIILIASAAIQVVNTQGKDYMLPDVALAFIYVFMALAFGCAMAFVLSTRDAPVDEERSIGAVVVNANGRSGGRESGRLRHAPSDGSEASPAVVERLDA